MLLPHNKEMRKLVDDARERLDQWSLRETDGELRYSLADLPLSIDALKQFGSALQRLNDELESCKKIPLSRSLTTEKRWHEEAFIRPQIQFRQDEALCDSCRRRPGSKGDFRGHEIHICPRCATERRIGAIIPKRRAVILHGEPSGDGPSLPFFESSMPDLMAKSSGNAEAVFHWKPVHERRSGLTIFVRKATYVPMDREGVMEFDEIAARAKGRHLLGYVKADVDNLGYLMARGLDYEFKRSSTDEPISRQSLSRVATLSRMLEGFFSGFVENICSKKYSSMYIVYSGGDDLLAIGPWDESLLFVSELRKKFREFTGDNAAFGLSAGVAIVQPRTPLLHAVEQAEQSLETAKSYRRKESKRTKDAIAIFGEAIEWPAFEKAISQGQQLAEWTRNNIISVGKVRRLMEYARMFDVYRKDPENTSQLRFITLLIYDLNRNWTGRTLEHQKAKEWAQQLANPSFGDLSALTLACNYSLLSNR
jgi:CRISPR-associated protein Csm1